jgi:hypothetical protein
LELLIETRIRGIIEPREESIMRTISFALVGLTISAAVISAESQAPSSTPAQFSPAAAMPVPLVYFDGGAIANVKVNESSDHPSTSLSNTPSDQPSIVPSSVPSQSAKPMSVPMMELDVVGNNGEIADGKEAEFPLGPCQGDCDSDDDCAEGLYCFDDDGPETVPGCNGVRRSTSTGKVDYCTA